LSTEGSGFESRTSISGKKFGFEIDSRIPRVRMPHFAKHKVKLSKILGSFLTVSNCNVVSHGEKG
jgi:hypothetical protein